MITREFFECVTKAKKDVSEDITKTMTENVKGNNKALANFNKKLLEILKARGIVAFYLLSALSKLTNLKHTSQYKPVKHT